MTVLCLETFVAAPIDRCFDLARDVEQHIASTAGTDERAVGGVTAGLLNLGDTVTWDARHFGVRWRLTSRITRLDQPRAFEDQQLHGPFATLHHTHTSSSPSRAARASSKSCRSVHRLVRLAGSSTCWCWCWGVTCASCSSAATPTSSQSPKEPRGPTRTIAPRWRDVRDFAPRRPDVSRGRLFLSHERSGEEPHQWAHARAEGAGRC